MQGKTFLLFAMLTMQSMAYRHTAHSTDGIKTLMEVKSHGQQSVSHQSVKDHIMALSKIVSREDFAQNGLMKEDMSDFEDHVKALQQFVGRKNDGLTSR